GLPPTYEAVRRAIVVLVSEAFTKTRGSTAKPPSRNPASRSSRRDGEAERVARAAGAGGPDAPAVQLDQPLGHGQAQAAAADRGAFTGPGALEGALELGGLERGRRILHREHHAAVIVLHAQRDAAAVGDHLQGRTQQVLERLLQARAVAVQAR